MTDEAHHIARQAAALDDPAVVREDVPDRVYLAPGLIRQAGGYPAALTTADNPRAVPYVRARPSQAGDERVARALQQGIDLIVGDLTGAEWKRACHDFVANARAALAAMDTPKGGGDE